MNNSIGGVRNRRTRALQRLENQLISGVKPSKTGDGGIINLVFPNTATEPLTYSDISRIKREIDILKTRV